MASRVEWAKRVDRWQRSGLSAAEFAEREGLKPKRLSWWRWKLRSTSKASRALVDFLPVHVVEPSAATARPTSPIEIALPNGRVVRVPADFDAERLGRVLAVASESPPC